MADTDSSKPNDSLSGWVTALQGQLHAGKAGPAEWAGATLRLLMLDVARKQVATEVAFEDALVARWRRLGLLQGTVPQEVATPAAPSDGSGGLLSAAQAIRKVPAPTKRPWWQWATLPVLVGVAALLLWPSRALFGPPAGVPADDAAVMRGTEGPQVIVSDRPNELATQVEAALRKRQFIFRRVALAASAVQLQAKLPAAIDPALAAELSALGVQVPAHGRLDVVIRRGP
jgi:hypothetical protein